MRHRVSLESASKRRPGDRPTVERLEDRLPPGDAVLGGLLAGWFSGAHFSGSARDPWASEVAIADRFPASWGNSIPALHVNGWSFVAEVGTHPSDKAPSTEQGAVPEGNRSDLRDSVVWDKDGVDQLLANNFDGLWALPFGASPAARRALTGTSEAGNSRPVQAEAGTNGSVGAPSGSAGAEAPPPPSSAESAAPTAKIPYGWIAGPQQPVTQPGLTGSGGVGPFGFVSNDPIDETPLPDTPGDVFATNTPGDSLGTGDIYSGNPPGDFSLPSGPGDIFSTNTPGYSPPSGGPGDIFSGNGSGTPPPSTGPGDIFSSNSPPNNPAPPVGTGDVFSSNSSDKNCTNTSPAVQPNANNGQAGSAVSGNPVREFDGMPVISATDLSSSALGFPWGQTRSWTGLNNSSFNGNGWAVSELPYLVVGGGINGGPDVAPGTTPDNRISVIQGGDSTYTFTIPSSGPYTSYPAWGAQNNRLDWVPGSVPILRLTDSQGNVTEFYDVNRNATNQPIAHSMGTDLSHKYGRFKSYTAANGISQVTADYDAAGYLTAVTLTDSATGATDQFAYTYATVTNDLVAAANASPPQLVTQVTLQRSDGQGGWQPVQRAEYSYYTGRLPNGAGGWQNDPNGRLGDLQMVQIENPVATGDGSITWQRIDAHYYRYYKLTGEGFLPSQGPTNNALTTGGPDPIEPSGGKYNSNSPGAGGDLHLFSGLKTVVGGAALDRLADAVPNYLTASDAAIQPYVNNFFTYERWADHVGSDGDPSFGANYWENTDTNYYWRTGYRVGTRYRVTEEIAQGAGCSTCSGGQGTSKFEYAGNYDLVGLGFNTIDYNLWRMKTTEYLPGDSPNWGDHDREVVYTDEVGQPVLEDYVHVGGASMAVTSMTVTASSASGGTITVVAPNHGLNTGDVVAISGVLPELYNGVFTVTRVDANTFRFTLPFHYYGPNVDNPDVPQPYINQTVAATSVHTTITKVLGQWETSYRYDDQGRLILKAMPSSVSGFDDSQSDLLSKDTPGHYQNLYDHQGLIELADYYDSTTATETTPGGVAGYLKDTKIEQGQLGTPVLQRSQQYYAHSVVNPTVDVRVTTPQGTSAATPVDQFTYTAPVVAATPVVTGLGPASGVREGGYNVTLIGSHFTGAFAVLFGGVATSSFAVRSDNVINVYSIPAHAAGVVDVTVVTPSGTSITSAGDEFTYVARPAPVVTGVGAATGFTPGGENVILVGSSFTGATAVSFGGVAPSFFHVDSDSQITVTGVPAHTAGVVDVTVTTPSGTSAISAADQYTYLTRPAPVVAGLGPPAGLTQGGYTTTIVGSSFTGATAVSFGGTVVSFFHVDSDTQISVFNTPAHSAGVVDVTVTTPSGTSALSAADQFTYLASSPAPGAPTITGLSPATGLNLGGYRVTVVGSNFSKATAVSFGGKSVSFSVDSDSRISIFDAPAHAAGVVDITVTTPSGTSATSAADQFTYLAPVPAITALGPATGLNLGGYTVTMVGSHFSGATTVSFGGKSVPFTVNSDNQITVFGLPAHAAGVVDVTVTTPSGTSALSAADQFIYIAPLPTVSALAPASGLNLGGYSVTLVGNHFSGATNVSFGGKSVSFSVDSDNQITVFSLPAHAAGMVDVTVTTPSGTSDLSPADQFTFLGPVPTVSGLGPPFGLNGGGDSLSVVGSHFTGATAISFGGSTVNNFQVVSDSLITVFRTPAHAAGVVDVRVTTPSGTSAISAPDQFTYGPSRPPPGPPVVGGLTPTAGSAGGGDTVTIVGSNFTNASSVSFGGLAAPSLKVLSDSMLNAVVPAQTEPAVYPIATQTVYRNADGTGAETTSYSYTWFAGSTRMQSQTMSRPVVSADQNGPGIADTQSTVYDVDGRPIWQRDGDGFLTYTAYDPSTSAVVEQIVDVDTSRSGDFQDLPAGWTTPAGGGRHLITRYEVDRFGRTTAMTEPNGNITYTVYNDPAHEMRTYPGWQAGTNLPTGPTQVIREDRDHSPSYTEVLTMSAVPHVDPAGRPDGTEPISDVQSLSRSFTSPGSQVVETDRYFSLSGQTYSTDPYLGIAGTNYNATFYAYDERGRLDRTVSPTGTINRAIYDGLGRMVSTWVGTDDTPASGYWSPENNTAPSNMVEVSAMVYDNGGVGDGNLTEQTRFPGGGAAPRVTQDFYDWRDRRVASKQGVQDVEANGTHRPIWYTVYDNLDKTLSQGEYDGDGVSITVSNGVPDRPPANRLRALTTNQYDDQGRLFQTNMFSVDPNDGTVSLASLTTSSWYDHRGNVIKRVSPGGLVTKNQYDGAGMLVATYQTDGQGDATWADAGSVANNNVLSQTETQYDADNNPILVIARQRFHDETAAGALGDPTNSPKARVSYVASYYDPANRLTDQVDVGTNGGMAYTRPDAPPAGSDTVLVTHTDYDPAGRIQDVVDPRGLVTQTTYDLLGRTVETIEGYSGDGTPTDSTNRTTVYTYDGADHVLTQTAVLPNNQTQTTQYVYGVTGLISSNDLLAAVIYADNGLPNTQTYTYDALGEALTKTDRNGSTHTYSYDVLGRQIADAVTTLGSGVDGTILRLETAYDSAGRPYLYTSYDAASGGNIVNQVMQIYNGLGQLVRQYQAHTGPVDPASTPAVQYAYSEMAGGANHSRLISMTYPNGREIDYTYAAGVDDAIGRLTSISDSTGILESYRYLGLSTIVVRSHPQSGVDLTYLQQPGQPTGDAGDQYTGLDRFGRVVDQLWLNTNTGTATDEFAYGYDADGNPLYRQNVVNPAFDELYHANGSGNGYDNFNQLTAFARGALDPSNNSITNPSHSQAWTLDALGNWQTVTTDGIDQNRTFDAQNQITSIGGLATPGYDNNGNTVTDQNDNTLVYDAWNRLIRVEDSDGRPLSTYTYDALGRRITETSTATMDLYFSKDWQVVEEQSGGEMQTQYVWSPAYEDAMVERDTSDGTRLYVQQDANWNVTAVVDATGTVQERYVYDPYGQVSFLAPDWSARSSSSVNWIYLHQGGRFDTVSGLYNFRNRDFSPVLGRWLQQDPMAFAAGDNNLYGCLAENPLGADDPLGLKPCCKETHIDGTYWNAVVMFEMNLLMKHIFAEGSYVPRGVGWARVPPTGQDPYPDWSSHGYLAASGFDSPFWGSSVKKDAFIFDDGPLKGHVLKGYETNYYFQGMIARAYGVSLPGLYAMMFLWKGWNMYVMKMPDYQWPSEGELFAATAGYRNFTKDYIEWANAVKAGKEIKNPGVPCI